MEYPQKKNIINKIKDIRGKYIVGKNSLNSVANLLNGWADMFEWCGRYL